MKYRLLYIGCAIICTLLFLQCKDVPTVPGSRESGFSILDYCSEQEKNKDVFRVNMIFRDKYGSDTILNDHYRMDTLLKVLMTYDISQKGKSTLYSRDTIEKNEQLCEKYQAENDALNIRYMEVCRLNDVIVKLTAEKKQRTLINSLYQLIEYRPSESFSMHTSLINRWKRDTVINDTEIYFLSD